MSANRETQKLSNKDQSNLQQYLQKLEPTDIKYIQQKFNHLDSNYISKSQFVNKDSEQPQISENGMIMAIKMFLQEKENIKEKTILKEVSENITKRRSISYYEPDQKNKINNQLYKKIQLQQKLMNNKDLFNSTNPKQDNIAQQTSTDKSLELHKQLETKENIINSLKDQVQNKQVEMNEQIKNREKKIKSLQKSLQNDFISYQAYCEKMEKKDMEIEQIEQNLNNMTQKDKQQILDLQQQLQDTNSLMMMNTQEIDILQSKNQDLLTQNQKLNQEKLTKIESQLSQEKQTTDSFSKDCQSEYGESTQQETDIQDYIIISKEKIKQYENTIGNLTSEISEIGSSQRIGHYSRPKSISMHNYNEENHRPGCFCQ